MCLNSGCIQRVFGVVELEKPTVKQLLAFTVVMKRQKSLVNLSPIDFLEMFDLFVKCLDFCLHELLCKSDYVKYQEQLKLWKIED